ncbi:hypothetical protein FYK42_09310 [Escherichia coli]|nr:hypothetical protein FYK42_09310 [Escherichia coli]
MSRNTALVFRYRGSGRTATTGEVFLVRAVSRGISQPLTHLSRRQSAFRRKNVAVKDRENRCFVA